MNLMTCERCRREDMIGAAVGLWRDADPAHSMVLAAAGERPRLCGLCATTVATAVSASAGKSVPTTMDLRGTDPLRPANRAAGPKHRRRRGIPRPALLAG
jgi:hypothetical protein